MSSLVGPADVAYVLYSVMPLDWIWRLARLYGKLTYLASRRERAVVRRNLATALGGRGTPRELDELTRRFFEYKRVRGVMLAVAPRLSEAELAKLLPVEGHEHLDEALETKRGVILLGSHLNSVCLFPVVRALNETRYDVHVAMPERADPWPATRVRRVLERRFGTRSLSELIGGFYAQFNIRPIVRLLARNSVVAQTGDGLHAAGFVEVEFLGRQLPFPTGMLRVAQLTGAVVVPIFQLGAPPDRLHVVLEEPFVVEEGDEALRRSVAAYAKRLEHHLLENIACWEHWLIEDTLGTMARWPQKPLKERYAV